MRLACPNQLSPTQNLMGNGMQASARNAGAATDPDWASVVLLAINENGADTSTTFIDASGVVHTLTAAGNAQWDTAQAPTGMTSSGLFGGAGDYLGVTTANCLNDMVSNANVTKTIECWLNPTTLTTGAQLYTCSTFLEKGNLYIGFAALNNGTVRLYWFDVGSQQKNIDSSAGAIATGSWYHVAFDFNGAGIMTIYVNGTSVGSGTFNGVQAGASGTTESIGRNQQSAGAFWNGYIGPVRITNARRYTANFTPPSLPLPTS